MLNLKMQMQSITLSKDIVNANDTVRVSITTLPDGQKQAQTIEVSNFSKIQPTFTIRMNNQTEKIIIVFRRINVFSDNHIIASTCLKSSDIHIFKELINNEHKKVSIYEPIQGKDNNKKKQITNRRIIGCMDIEFTLKEEFSRQNYIINKENKQEFAGNSFSKYDSLMMNQAKGNSDFIFQDLILN